MNKSRYIEIFEQTNKNFLNKELDFIFSRVNERAWYAPFTRELVNVISKTEFQDYHVDIEYNLNGEGLKTIIDEDLEVIRINCDIILHSRGRNILNDNLIAIEMKKHRGKDKQKDKERLKLLTKDSYDDIWSCNGTSLPEHVCHYQLGVYYEVNSSNKSILIEYYEKGEMIECYTMQYEYNLKEYTKSHL